MSNRMSANRAFFSLNTSLLPVTQFSATMKSCSQKCVSLALWRRRDSVNVCVGLHECHAAVVRHPHRQNALFCQHTSVDVPAHHCGDDLVFVISSPSDEKFVVTSSDGATRPFPQTGHKSPGVGQRRVAVHGMHGTTNYINAVLERNCVCAFGFNGNGRPQLPAVCSWFPALNLICGQLSIWPATNHIDPSVKACSSKGAHTHSKRCHLHPAIVKRIIGLHTSESLNSIKSTQCVHFPTMNCHFVSPAPSWQRLDLYPLVQGAIIFPNVMLRLFTSYRNKEH